VQWGLFDFTPGPALHSNSNRRTTLFPALSHPKRADAEREGTVVENAGDSVVVDSDQCLRVCLGSLVRNPVDGCRSGTTTPNFDRVKDGTINAKDLSAILEEMKTGNPDCLLIFEFARYWMEPSASEGDSLRILHAPPLGLRTEYEKKSFR